MCALARGGMRYEHLLREFVVWRNQLPAEKLVLLVIIVRLEVQL